MAKALNDNFFSDQELEAERLLLLESRGLKSFMDLVNSEINDFNELLSKMGFWKLTRTARWSRNWELHCKKQAHSRSCREPWNGTGKDDLWPEAYCRVHSESLLRIKRSLINNFSAWITNMGMHLPSQWQDHCSYITGRLPLVAFEERQE